VSKEPTVQALQGESTVIALSWVLIELGLGGCTPVQLWQSATDAAARTAPVIAPASISDAARVLARSFEGRRRSIWVLFSVAVVEMPTAEA
jgi:hypothetical protein